MRSLKPVRLTARVIATVITVAAAAGFAASQSTDRTKPTPLATRDLMARSDYPIPKSGWAKTLYFTFDAGPGDVKVTVMSWSGELTSHKWDNTPNDPNIAGSKGDASAPGRPAGGWYEQRFGNGVYYNVNFFHEDPTRTEPRTESEKTTTHPHGTTPRAVPLGSVGLIAPQEKGRREVTKTFRLPDRRRLIMIVNVSGRFDYRIKLDGPIVIADPH